jgi:integrase
VTGHVLDVNPALAVRGPKYVVKKGKTPVLTAGEARELLDSIEVIRSTAEEDGTEAEEPEPAGLRDRALIGVMVYTFARIDAVIQMKVRDYFVQGRRGWVRLYEKGGKEHELPCHHNLEEFLDTYIAAAGIAGDPDGPLFRTTGQQQPMWQQFAYR